MLAEPVGSTENGGGGAAEDHILIREEQSSGTPGGTFTDGVWQTRTLNAEIYDTGNHAWLSSNQITLAAGTYRAEAYAPAFKINRHKLKLRNITDATDIVIGLSAFSGASDTVHSNSVLNGRFTIASSKVIELQHRCLTTFATSGFGVASDFGVIEVYSTIKFIKEA